MSRSPRARVMMLLENAPYPQDGRVRSEATTLVEAGYQVSVIAPRRRGQPRHEVLEGVRVYRYPPAAEIPGFVGYLVEYAWAMVMMGATSLWVALREGVDIIHAHNPPDALVLIAAPYKLLGKRFVFDQHDSTPSLFGTRFTAAGASILLRVLLWLERLSFQLADHVIETNVSHMRLGIARHALPKDRVTIVRNGPYLDYLTAGQGNVPVRKYPDKSHLVYVGVIGFQDGLDYLLRSLAHLVFDMGRTDVSCTIMGSGPALPAMRALSGQLGLDAYVDFVGWVSREKLLPRLQEADIGLVPDPSNAYNDLCTMIKLLEYMSVGIPAVAFDMPEHRFSAGEAALYACPNDERDFARKIALLLDDPQRRAHMGQIGRQRIETELAWSYQAKHLLAVYRRVMPGRPR